MSIINTYLTFNGATESAFNFYKSVFGGEFTIVQRFKDMPDGDKLPVEDQVKIMHLSYSLPNGTILMGSDALSSMGKYFVQGDNFSLSISADSEQEADRIFSELSVYGKVTMPIAKTFWNAYFGMFTDKFGIQWMVNYDYK